MSLAEQLVCGHSLARSAAWAQFGPHTNTNLHWRLIGGRLMSPKVRLLSAQCSVLTCKFWAHLALFSAFCFLEAPLCTNAPNRVQLDGFVSVRSLQFGSGKMAKSALRWATHTRWPLATGRNQVD